MKRFSLLSLLLFTAFLGASLAWWLERTKKPDVVYLHLFHRYYDLDYDLEYPKIPRKTARIARRLPVRLVTMSISPSVPFSATMPNDYNPTIHLDGALATKGRDRLQGEIEIDVQSPETAYRIGFNTPLTMDEITAIDDRFFFILSRSAEAYDLPALQKEMTEYED